MAEQEVTEWYKWRKAHKFQRLPEPRTWMNNPRDCVWLTDFWGSDPKILPTSNNIIDLIRNRYKSDRNENAITQLM